MNTAKAFAIFAWGVIKKDRLLHFTWLALAIQIAASIIRDPASMIGCIIWFSAMSCNWCGNGAMLIRALRARRELRRIQKNFADAQVTLEWWHAECERLRVEFENAINGYDTAEMKAAEERFVTAMKRYAMELSKATDEPVAFLKLKQSED
jgi:hypothetical protein